MAIERHQTHKRSQAVSQESDLYLTRLPGDQADAAALALIGRGHWGDRTTNGMRPWGRRLVAPAKLAKPWLPGVTSCQAFCTCAVCPFYAAFGASRSIPCPCIVG